MAGKMIERLNTKYENLLKEATHLENALTKVDEIIAKTQELKRLYNVIVSELPYEVQNNFGLQHCWR
jgi:prefoldin subunit 5